MSKPYFRIHRKSGRCVGSMVCVGFLLACDGNPGTSRIEVYAAEDGHSVWDRTLSTARFEVIASDTPGALRVQGYDNCWDARFRRDLDRDTGATLKELPSSSSAEVSPSPVEFDPPTLCPGRAQKRVVLTNGQTVDVCDSSVTNNVLIVLDVDTGGELLRVPTEGATDIRSVGDRLLVAKSYAQRLDMFSLETGESLWTWRAPDEFTFVLGADLQRVYAWQQATSETFALSVVDGTPVWQANLGCDWLSYTDGLLICGETRRTSTCAEPD